MLKKIIAIKNIGRFVDYKATGDTEMRKLTLVFAENGRGKTTLCDVLRSLATGRPDYILGRKTLASIAAPAVQLRIDGSGTVSFANGAWSARYADLAIFDSTFVHQNVYAGDQVSVDQRRNLYQVIVGEEGVTLAREVDRIDEEIKVANATLNQRKGVVQTHVPKVMSVEAFLALPMDDDIEAKLAASEATIAALDRADEVQLKQSLSPVAVPLFPTEFPGLLAKSIEDVAVDAENLMRAHLDAHTAGGDERWLQQGLRYVKGNSCPFCGQDLYGTPLVHAYRAYFSASYEALKQEIAAMSQSVDVAASDAALLAIETVVTRNLALADFWRQFTTIDVPVLPMNDAITPAFRNLHAIARAYLERKAQAPLERLVVEADVTSAAAAFDEAIATVHSYNARVNAANAGIQEAKRTTEAGNIDVEKGARAILLATKHRHGQPAQTACEGYVEAVESKRVLEADKVMAKQRLDDYTAAIFTRYQTAINALLERFGAGFRITNTGRTYMGGRAASTYQILINETPVDLGDGAGAVATPCFKNTLSSGDRSTLGLAFFLAQIQHDAGLANKVIVLDDPFNSQDRFRRTCTQQLITKLAAVCRQVIVLSHDPGFLKLIWDSTPAADIKTLQLARAGTNTVLNEWDIEAETKAGYFQDHGTLISYDRDGSGDPRDVVRRIRPVMEGYLRIRFPGHFLDKEWLGDFIKKIRDADQTNSLFPVKSILTEIEDINDYSKKYHHEQNPAADVEQIEDGELQTYVKRALALVGGY